MWRHAALAAACLATAAHAADGTPSNYAGVQGGVNNLGGTWNANVSLGPGVTLPGVANAKRGTHFGVFGGRQTERARFELEWQHGSFDVTGLSRGPVSQSISSSGHYDAVTANAYRFQPVWDQRIDIYGALGIGWGRVNMPEMGFTTPHCDCFRAASKSGFAWLARAGAEYKLGEQDRLFLQYTFLALPRPGSHSTPGVEYSHKNVGSVAAGYRHNF